MSLQSSISISEIIENGGALIYGGENLDKNKTMISPTGTAKTLGKF